MSHRLGKDFKKALLAGAATVLVISASAVPSMAGENAPSYMTEEHAMLFSTEMRDAVRVQRQKMQDIDQLAPSTKMIMMFNMLPKMKALKKAQEAFGNESVLSRANKGLNSGGQFITRKI